MEVLRSYRVEPDTVAKVLRRELSDRTRGAWPQSSLALRVIISGGLRGVEVLRKISFEVGVNAEVLDFRRTRHVHELFATVE
jgi:hypothetical protein